MYPEKKKYKNKEIQLLVSLNTPIGNQSPTPFTSLEIMRSSEAARSESNELRNYVTFFNIIIPRFVVEEVI